MKSLNLLIIVSLFVLYGCNPILNTTVLGLHINNHYTPEDIVTTIGAKGDFIEVIERSLDDFPAKIICFEDILFKDITWDETEINLSGDNLLMFIEFNSTYYDKRECREVLYSLKSQFDKKFGKPSLTDITTKDEKSSNHELFEYSDSKDKLSGGRIILKGSYDSYYSLQLIYADSNSWIKVQEIEKQFQDALIESIERFYQNNEYQNAK